MSLTETSAGAELAAPSGAAPVLEVVSLEKAYGAVKAVQGLSFQVAPGEVLGLVGPNGAGKTSTLRCLAGILPVSSGRVVVAGHDVAVAPVEAKRALAFLPDEPRLFEYLTVWEHLNFVARLYGVEAWEEKARALLVEMELASKETLAAGRAVSRHEAEAVHRVRLPA